MGSTFPLSIQQHSLTLLHCAGQTRKLWGGGGGVRRWEGGIPRKQKSYSFTQPSTCAGKMKLSLVMLSAARKLWHIREKRPMSGLMVSRIVHLSWSQNNKARRARLLHRTCVIHKLCSHATNCSLLLHNSVSFVRWNPVWKAWILFFFSPFLAFWMSCEVRGKVHSVQFACCCRMLHANFCVNFYYWYTVKQSRALRMNISGLFNISLRVL